MMQRNKKMSLTNWKIIIPLFLLLFLLFPGLPILQIVAILLFVSQILVLFEGIGSRMPIREIFGTLFCLQFLIGPMIAYYFGDQYVIDIYKMRVSQEEYYSFLIPTTVAFIVGLNIKHNNFSGEGINMEGIKALRMNQPYLPHYFIAAGFVFGTLEGSASAELKFVFYLLGALKYIGLFLMILSDKKLNLWFLIIIVGYMVSIAVNTGMFHDLFTWTIFIAAFFFLRFRIRPIFKLGVFLSFTLLATGIQFIKFDYREVLSNDEEEVGIETFGTVYTDATKERGSMFSESNIALNSTRINQGFIIAHVLSNVPSKEPFADGASMKQIFLSAIMPRFLYADKLNAGDQEIFMKYSGLQLNKTTAMALSSVGDAYANYGKFGCWVFMFFYGLLFNLTLKFLARKAKIFPVISLFVPLIFIFPIRPDCETQTILGHLVKSTFLVLLVLHLFRTKFRYYRFNVSRQQ
jgi:hypothetical protein